MRGGLRSSTTSGKLKRIACVVVFALTPSFASAQEGTRPASTKRKVFTADDKFLTLFTEHLKKIPNGNHHVLRLERKGDAAPVQDDVVLDFESAALFSNPANQPLILKSRLERTVHTGFNGSAAQFSLPEHKLKVRLPPFLHLSGDTLTTDSGDFTFACEFEPHSAQAEILRRENFFLGRQYLFAVTMRNNRIVVTLENLLQQAGSERGKFLASVELKSIDKVHPGKHNFLALTYNEAEGKLVLTLNNREQAVHILRRSAGENYTVSFTELKNAPLALFASYTGYADNILFSNRVISDEDLKHHGAIKPYGDRYEQRRGILKSDIFDMGFSQSNIAGIAAQQTADDENLLAVKYRCLDRKFSPRLTEQSLRFDNIAHAGGKKCRFIQFKAEFLSDNAGRKSPQLRQIALEYRENPPPDRPAKLRILSVEADAVEVEIAPNTELDVVKGGRYIIYYGHKPHQIEGAVYFRSGGYEQRQFRGEPIAHKMPMRVRLSNDTISVNKSWADKNPRFKNRYPVFEPGIGYYFWVTACDNAYGEAQELADHESAPSEAVFVRFK